MSTGITIQYIEWTNLGGPYKQGRAVPGHGHVIMTMVTRGIVRQIAAGRFKAKCLRLMDEVQHTREPLVITKKGRPVAKLVPADEPPKDIFGCLKGVIEVVGDIESPAVPASDWEVLR